MSGDELGIEKRWLVLTRINPENFILFFEKYYDRIYRSLYLRTLDHDVAEDLTSETFIKAQANLWRFRWQGVTMGAWLHRIAHNQLKNYYRKESKKLNISQEEFDSMPSPASSPLMDLILTEDQARVYELVKSLDETSKNIFLYHYWQSYSVKEISVILKLPEGTIKARLSRERAKMEHVLKHSIENKNRTSD